MSPRPLRLPAPGPAAVAAGGLLLAALLGAVLATDVRAGTALALALGYVPLVLLDLPAGLAVWVGLVFLERVPGIGASQTLAGVLVLAAWLAVLARRSVTARATFARHRALFAALGLLVVWLTVSLLWARDPGRGMAALLTGWAALLAFLVVATAAGTERAVRLVAAGFVAGAVLSVLVGLADTGIASGASADAAAGDTGRFLGTLGDPNLLAAGLVPAIALAAGLLAVCRDALARVGLVAAIGVCAAGLAASQSRGGFLAAAAALACALLITRGRRPQVLATVLVLVACGGAWFSAHPAALERVTESDTSGGTGRTELWSVAREMALDHPVLGVGLANFGERSPEYAQVSGVREFGEYVAEDPHEAHNTLLQVAAELGVVGLALLLVVVAGALRATLRAARRFEAAGRAAHATLARAALCAQVGALVAGLFITNLQDKRAWVLLALGPALLAAAARDARR